jgi:hypothetical protein
MNKGKTIQEWAAELDRQNSSKKDYITDTRNISMETLINTNKPVLKVQNGTTRVFDINSIAHRQLGEYTGIPAKYYDKMREEAPELLTQSVNTWLQKQPATRMIRTLDGTARAFLSDRYRRIDNYEMAMNVLPVIREMRDAHIESCELTDTKMYLKVVNPRLEMEVKKGDIVQAGIVISNSEVGHGAFSVYPLIYFLACTNGMIAEDSGQRKYHVGRTVEESDYEIFSDATMRADDHALSLKVKDIVRTAIDQVKFATIVNRLRESTEARITSPDIPKVIELTAKEYSITHEETNNILMHLIQGGDLSLYGLSNAVTRTAQDIKDYDRATRLEATGWELVNMDGKAWNRINREAA